MSSRLRLPGPIAGIALVAIAIGISPAAARTGASRDTQVGGLQNPPAPTQQKPVGTAVLRGHVVDASNGRPIRGALVRAVAPDIRANQSATTDAQGSYELRDLPAGHYVVTANKSNYVGLSYGQLRVFESGTPLEIRDNQVLDKIDFSLPRGGVIAGRIADEYGDPVPNVRVSAMRSQYVMGRRRLFASGPGATTDDLGDYRIFGLTPGDYYLSASFRPGPAAPGDDPPAYAVSYFPGTPGTKDAQKLAIGIGVSLTDVNVALVRVKAARVSGSVLDAQGQPVAAGNIMLTDVSSSDTVGYGGQVRADGSFSIQNVPPGNYLAIAQGPFKQGSAQDRATVAVTVAGENVDGVQLIMLPKTMASGVVIVDPAAAASLRPSTIRWTVRGAEPPMGGILVSGSLRDDFTFEASGSLQPGLNLVGLQSLPSGFAVRAVRVGGVDVTDTGFNVKPNENVSGIEIELTSQPTTVMGQLTDLQGAPSRNGLVVIFSRDERKWEGMSRYMQTARPNLDGTFKIAALPPGDYLAVAVEGMDPAATADPEVLKQLRGQATMLSLNEGETKTIALKLTGPP